MARTYDDEQRVAALASIEAHGGVNRAAARDVDMPLTTLEYMHDQSLAAIRTNIATPPPPRDAVQTNAARPPAPDYVALWGRAQELGARIVAANLERFAGMELTVSQVKDVAVITAIASDKFLDHRDGRKGAVTLDNSQHLTLPAGSTLDDVRALRDSLRAAARDERAEAGGGAAALT